MIKYIAIALFLITGEGWAMKLTSKDFVHEGFIPQLFSCEGEDTSPELSWADVPQGTKSFVLICDDPDAPVGTWDHWVLFNLPADTAGLARSIKAFPKGTGFGQNSWKRNDYGGPCPPSNVHRYYFKLYALDTRLNLQDGSNVHQVEAAMAGHVLAEAVLMGRYKLLKK